MTPNIKQLSEKLAQMYGVDAYRFEGYGEPPIYLAEDSGRISDLADDNGINIIHFLVQDGVAAKHFSEKLQYTISAEEYKNHPTKHDAARMARVRCLLSIGERREHT